MKNLIFASTAALCIAGLAAGDLYQIDNDEPLTNIGVPGGSITWANAFETTDTNLENIAFGFGIQQAGTGTLVGEEMLWEVFGAQGDTPSFLQSLAAGSHIIENENFWGEGNLDVISVDVDLTGYS